MDDAREVRRVIAEDVPVRESDVVDGRVSVVRL